MKNWNLIFRRVHLYLGMLLIPWVAMYALSTVIFNHGEHFKKYRPADPQWTSLWEKDYTLTVEAGTSGEPLRAAARQILEDNEMKGGFLALRQGERININMLNFWRPKRLAYDLTTKKLRAEEKKFSWVEVFARLHQRTGYGQGGLLNNLWALFVDLYCVTTLVWIFTGLYLWWKIPVVRNWGWLAIGGGVVSIVVLLLTV